MPNLRAVGSEPLSNPTNGVPSPHWFETDLDMKKQKTVLLFHPLTRKNKVDDAATIYLIMFPVIAFGFAKR